MALGIPMSGQSKPFIRYDARAGRFSKLEGKDQVDITQGFTAVFDMAQIEVGWALFAANTAPEFIMARVGKPFPSRPSDKHKAAFRLMLKLPPSMGGDVREFASAAGCVGQAIDELHDAYLSAVESKSGLLPVVQMQGSTPVKTQTPGGMTTNYKPNFAIVKWVPRPADLPLEADEAPAAEPAPARVLAPAGADLEF